MLGDGSPFSVLRHGETRAEPLSLVWPLQNSTSRDCHSSWKVRSLVDSVAVPSIKNGSDGDYSPQDCTKCKPSPASGAQVLVITLLKKAFLACQNCRLDLMPCKKRPTSHSGTHGTCLQRDGCNRNELLGIIFSSLKYAPNLEDPAPEDSRDPTVVIIGRDAFTTRDFMFCMHTTSANFSRGTCTYIQVHMYCYCGRRWWVWSCPGMNSTWTLVYSEKGANKAMHSRLFVTCFI